MSLIVHMKVPGAIILASDCRVTGNHRTKNGSFSYVLSDREEKTFLIHPRLAFSYSGEADLSGMPCSFLMNKAAASLRECRSTEDAARGLLNFFQENGNGKHPSFLISGFQDTPSVLDLPADTVQWKEQYPKENVYGITTMGDSAVAQAIIKSGTCDYHLFRIPDAIQFAKLLIETTAEVQSFQKTRQTVSKTMDILVLTEEKAQWVMRSSDPFQL